jgi:hypothetical protein
MSDPHAASISSGPSAETGATDPHAHGAHPGLPFTEAEWRDFHESDKGAGAAIIILMSGIFTIGLVLYSIVTYTVAR